MSWIGARKSDWHPDSPRIRPSVWFVPVILAVVVVVITAALAGNLLNGDGSPLLS